ncbi:MAG: 1-deoxy-D-xylulose-5-phosphate synthase [Fibrobacteres bacterium]|jgi:1-deoxy-D-xylulose-5-phosphate synthase|nr:1-deoxy-D-xylulose-5-phosphate synthase [Fibrobacterota bacterium]
MAEISGPPKPGPLLSLIRTPEDVKKLGLEELAALGAEMREFIVSTISRHGGHLSPNLGTVELTLALFKVYCPGFDRFVWDVGHQAYPHKLLSGRNETFHTIRQHGGLSGFLKRSESKFDDFGAGHASTSISAALGMSVGRDLLKRTNRVFAIIGDGSLTGGMALEALNNAGVRHEDLTVILNDNKMSIAENVGSIAKHLNRVITDPRWNKFRKDVWGALGHLDKVGKGWADQAREAARKVEEAVKGMVLPGSLFEDLGFRYYGPLDGHDLPTLVDFFEKLKDVPGPKLVHVITQKGKGYEPAEKDTAGKWHGLGAFDPETGKVAPSSDPRPSYTQVFGEALLGLAKDHSELVAITGAMPSGTGVNVLAKAFPDRVFDVGIAEQHAVTFAAGLACEGIRPVVAIYSTFLQRAYDQIVHDVAIQHLPVIFCLDRGGLVGADGPTHHGVLDLAYMRTIQTMVVMAPKDEMEMVDMLHTAYAYKDGPTSIRYPRGSGRGVPSREPKLLEIGVPEVLRQGSRVALFGIGSMVETCEKVSDLLREVGIEATVVNARFAKPLSPTHYQTILAGHDLVVTLEDGVRSGGYGSAVAETMADLGLPKRHLLLGHPADRFIDHGDNERLYQDMGLDAPSIASRIRQTLENS